MVETRDILLKAAEDVQQGMWCKTSTFRVNGEARLVTDLLYGDSNFDFIDPITLDQAMASKRCAQGSLGVATMLLGGRFDEYTAALTAVQDRIGTLLWVYNDDHLPDDPFEAGQQLAELFRTTAESL